MLMVGKPVKFYGALHATAVFIFVRAGLRGPRGQVNWSADSPTKMQIAVSLSAELFYSITTLLIQTVH